MNLGQIGKKLDELSRLIKGLSHSKHTDLAHAVQSESWRRLSIANQIQLATGALLLATVVVSMLSYRVSRDALDQTQRAFLNPFAERDEPSFWETPSGRKHYMKVHEEWENTGETPAPVVISYIHYEKIPTSKFESWKFEVPTSEHFRKTFAGPHSRISGQFTSIPSDDILRPSQDMLLTVWGWMVYKDVLPGTEPHVTEFCEHVQEIDLKPGAPKPDPDEGSLANINLEWIACDRHNCVDGGCPDYKLVTANLKNNPQ